MEPKDHKSSSRGTFPNFYDNCHYLYLCPYVTLVVCAIYMGEGGLPYVQSSAETIAIVVVVVYLLRLVVHYGSIQQSLCDSKAFFFHLFLFVSS